MAKHAEDTWSTEYRHLRQELDRHRVSELPMVRLLLGGNAGGVVAALTLIAGLLRNSPAGTVPEPLLCLLAVFLAAGLFPILFVRGLDLKLDGLKWQIDTEVYRVDDSLPRRAIRWFKIRRGYSRSLIWLSMTALVVGGIGSLVFLYGLSDGSLSAWISDFVSRIGQSPEATIGASRSKSAT